MFMNSDFLWNEYKQNARLDADAKYAGELGFEKSGFFGAERLASLLAGKKRALFSALATYLIDNEPLPVTGEYYVVTDSDAAALCVIHLSAVQVLPFNEVTWEMAQNEGEDISLEEWRERTRENLEDEGELVGFEFSEDLKLIYMQFDLLYKRKDE